MLFPARQRYLIILAQCCKGIKQPLLTQLRAACPHLSEKQVRDLHSAKGRFFFALPPAKIRGRIQIGEYYRTPEAHLFIARAHSESADTPHPVLYRNEAVLYAEECWPKELTERTWVESQTIHVLNPAKLSNDGGPSFVANVQVGLTQKWQTILKSRQQKVEKWDEAIAIATTNVFEGSEIKDDQRNDELYNCAHCGGGLFARACSGCKLTYGGIPTSKSISLPLPPKLVRLLRESHGHNFQLDPARLYAME